MSVEPTEAVEREIRVRARPETVFDFFVEPELMLRWKGLAAELDPTPGGLYRVVMNPRNTVVGEYVEIDRPRRVVFTWGFEGEGHLVGPGGSTVEVTLTEEGDGTLVRLVHRGLPADARDEHGQGWAHYLARLRTAAGGDDPGRDPWADIGSDE